MFNTLLESPRKYKWPHSQLGFVSSTHITLASAFLIESGAAGLIDNSIDLRTICVFGHRDDIYHYETLYNCLLRRQPLNNFWVPLKQVSHFSGKYLLRTPHWEKCQRRHHLEHSLMWLRSHLNNSKPFCHQVFGPHCGQRRRKSQTKPSVVKAIVAASN